MTTFRGLRIWRQQSRGSLDLLLIKMDVDEREAHGQHEVRRREQKYGETSDEGAIEIRTLDSHVLQQRTINRDHNECSKDDARCDAHTCRERESMLHEHSRSELQYSNQSVYHIVCLLASTCSRFWAWFGLIGHCSSWPHRCCGRMRLPPIRWSRRFLVSLKLAILRHCKTEELVYHVVSIVIRPFAHECQLSSDRFLDRCLELDAIDSTDALFDLELAHDSLLGLWFCEPVRISIGSVPDTELI